MQDTSTSMLHPKYTLKTKFLPFPKLVSNFLTESYNCWVSCSVSLWKFQSWLSLSIQLLSFTKHRRSVGDLCLTFLKVDRGLKNKQTNKKPTLLVLILILKCMERWNNYIDLWRGWKQLHSSWKHYLNILYF